MPKSVIEEDVKITSYGDDISKKLTVFYNPVMKMNRDISLLVINSYFKDKKIKFCDPMAASGIREIRFLKTIPDKFEKLTIGDMSPTAIENIKKNFKDNKVNLDKVELVCADAINTIISQFYDFIEVDPFGSIVPFLDSALQRIKHNGILSVTATDTAALCGTYPKTCLRRYGMKVTKTLFYEEVGLRNLIAFCIREAGKFDKNLIPVVSITHNHFYKVFFKVEESRGKSSESINNLKYLKWDRITQKTLICDYEDKDSFGKTYVGKLNNKEFLADMLKDIDLIIEKKEVEKLINKLIDEVDLVGYYDPHKLCKENKINFGLKYEKLFEEIRKKGFEVSRVHNDKLGFKTDMESKEIVKIIKKFSS
jgi:tRNA (guanine26-N2/guanine27-N2)-dimethyltransferase